MEHHVEITTTAHEYPTVQPAFHAKCEACGWAVVTHDQDQARELGRQHEVGDHAIPVPAVPSPD